MHATPATVAFMLALANASLAQAPVGDRKARMTPQTEWSTEMLQRAQRSPRNKACWAATKFFLCAQCEHRIPAYSADASSKFDADIGAYSDLWTLAYPISFTFRVTRQHDQALYCYTVTKNSRFAITSLMQTLGPDRLGGAIVQVVMGKKWKKLTRVFIHANRP